MQDSQETLSIDDELVYRIVEVVVCLERAASAREVGVHFVSSQEIAELHLEYFGDDSSTDCISFPHSEEYLGDVFVCPSVAKEYAESHGVEPVREVFAYLVHGLLHLLGYSDKTPVERDKMRAREAKILGVLECMELLKTGGSRYS